MKFRGDRMKLRAAIVLFFILAFCMAVPAAAESSLRIKKDKSLGADSVELQVYFPYNLYGNFEIYRATRRPSRGGKLKLIDTVSILGNDWYFPGDGYDSWNTTGDRGQVTILCDDSELYGNSVIIDHGLKLNQTYYYRIVWRGLDGEIVESSNTATVKTRLEAPQILKCYSVSNTSVKIAWKKTDKAQGYQVYRKSGSGWTRVRVTKSGSATTYTNTRLRSNTKYYYRVRAYRKVGSKFVYSDYSQPFKVKTGSPTVSGSYSPGSVYGPSLNAGKLAEVRRVVQSFKENYIKSGMSDYEKLLAAFNYLRATCDYAWRGWQYNGANTAWGALVYGEAQCSGYARAMKALCDAIGIGCYYIHANSRASNPSHQWNLVKMDKKWYILDAQGGAFLVGSDRWHNQFGMYWNTSGLPACSREDHRQSWLPPSEV